MENFLLQLFIISVHHTANNDPLALGQVKTTTVWSDCSKVFTFFHFFAVKTCWIATKTLWSHMAFSALHILSQQEKC